MIRVASVENPTGIANPHPRAWTQSKLARTGRLEAVKRGKVWYTTQQAVDTYRRSVESVQSDSL